MKNEVQISTGKLSVYTQAVPAVLDVTPRFRWRFGLPPDATLRDVIRFLNAIDVTLHGSEQEFAANPLREFVTSGPDSAPLNTRSIPATSEEEPTP